jgi:hypothetical protein
VTVTKLLSFYCEHTKTLKKKVGGRPERKCAEDLKERFGRPERKYAEDLKESTRKTRHERKYTEDLKEITRKT